MILESKRLFLRKFTDEDANRVYELAKDSDVGPRAGWPSHKNVSESLNVIRNIFNSPFCYAICEKETNLIIGAIELKLSNNSLTDECELGYWLGKNYWGHQYMGEACTILIDHAFNDLNINTIFATYFEGNIQSKRVLEKLGFKYKTTTYNLDVPLLNQKRTLHINILTKEMFYK